MDSNSQLDYKKKYIKYKMKYLKFKKGGMITNNNEDNNKNNNIKLIGPVNLLYYDKILEDKDIMLLGDFHDSLNYDEECCDENIKQKITNFYHLVYGLYSNIVYYKTIYEFLNLLTNEQNEDILKTELKNMCNFLIQLKKYVKSENINKLCSYVHESYDKNKLVNLVQNEIITCKNTITKTLNSIIVNLNIDDKNCIIEHEFILNLSKTNCIDIFLEQSFHDTETAYIEYDIDKLGYLDLVEMLFSSMNFVKYFSININEYTLMKKYLSNIRYHMIDVRIRDVVENREEYVNLTNDGITDDNLIINVIDYITYLKYYILNNIENIISNNNYLKIYNSYNDDIKILINNSHEKIKKQFYKSTFKNDIERVFSIMQTIIFQDIFTTQIYSNEMHNDLCFYIENIRFNAYLLFRIFVSRGEWNKNRNLDNDCDNVDYPKNIIVSVGYAHTVWLRYFIYSYFTKIPNIIIGYDGPIYIGEEEFENSVDYRCIELYPEDKFFE